MRSIGLTVPPYESIFFSSKACDFFSIFSEDLVFSHNRNTALDLLEQLDPEDHSVKGTLVTMLVKNKSERTMNEVYDQYSSPDEGFYKTLVPVKLLRYKDEGIVSRSQAKRLLARFDKFRSIVLDFEGIDMIGQAFADEVFRVFQLTHPQVQLLTYYC